ncbi:MAG: hypothetical protein GXY83_00670 [Rhodopirellula sp.]|nr:hypothetical protein [Rhodopirellula sp.]
MMSGISSRLGSTTAGVIITWFDSGRTLKTLFCHSTTGSNSPGSGIVRLAALATLSPSFASRTRAAFLEGFNL